MIELGIVDDAFVQSLKNISDNKIKVYSPFNDGTDIKR